MENFVGLVLDHHHREAAARPDTVDGGQDVRGAGRVQVRGGLVQDEQRGFQRKHRGQRHALLLATGEFQHAPAPESRKPGQVQGVVDAAMDFRRIEQVVLQRESDLFLHREGHDLILRVLEQHVDAPEAFRRL